MNKDVNKILTILEKEGYEAYIVGGFSRDYYLGKINDDYDICTNATPRDIEIIFPIIEEKLGSMKIKYNNSLYEITTYRKETDYIKREPKIEYVNSLKEDLLRRDFTINTICINKNMEYIDLFGGINDINSKKIKVVGDANTRLKEDPLRILRAIRFATILDFDINEELNKAIKELGHLVKKLSFFRKREELDKIFLSDNCEKGIKLLKKYKLDYYLEIDINSLISTNNIFVIWAQVNYSPRYPFTKKELKEINTFKKLFNLNYLSKYDIYCYGYERCNLVAILKGIKIDNNLIINSRKDIDIRVVDIATNSKKDISDTYILIEKEILLNNLENKKNKIINFIKNI